MNHSTQGVSLKIRNFYQFLPILLVIMFLILYYPRIYGTDAFQIIWMAQALKNGALVSEKTWLINPASFFGYYPFSHRPIGVPIILAFLIQILDFSSLGIFGLNEAIFIFNLILLLISYKTAKSLGNIIFKEEWARFIFIVSILFSPYLLTNTMMTISSRFIISIIIMVLLKINLKILNNSINKFKATFIIFSLILLSLFIHRLWLVTFLPSILMIFIAILKKSNKIQRIIIFLILPICVISLFLGFQIFSNQLERPGRPGATVPLFLRSIYFMEYYSFELGIISFFFLPGVIIIIYKLATLSKNNNYDKLKFYDGSYIKKYYLMLFLLPFVFTLPTKSYALIVFYPIFIIFSVYGLIEVKKIISLKSKILYWLLVYIVLGISVIYSFISSFLFKNSLLQLLLVISIILPLTYYIIGKIKSIDRFKLAFLDDHKVKDIMWVLILVISFSIFSLIRIERSTGPDSRYLTKDEIEIITYFQNENIQGYIFTPISLVCTRIGSVGFLPTFFDTDISGKALYYGFISPNEVHESTSFFSFDDDYFFESLTLFRFNATNPLRDYRKKIVNLNVSVVGDRSLLRDEYNIQYIIGLSDSNWTGPPNYSWVLIESLQQSDLEVFSTNELKVWQIF